MQILDLTFSTPEANLACDEVLLNRAEETGAAGVLRFWESKQYFVVVGYSNRIENEVEISTCHKRGIPILRRVTGGGTVVQGPGCLNYALILPISDSAHLRDVASTNRWIMEQNRRAISAKLGRAVTAEGVTDLASDGRKFSGNSQRRKRQSLIFHGTFLYRFDLELIQTLLRFPSRQPDYRASRPHGDFLTNFPLEPGAIKQAMQTQWNADAPFDFPLEKQVHELAQSKYAKHDWNEKF